MMRKILAVVFVLTLVACSNAERYSEADIEDSPMIQERICLASGKTCKGMTQKIGCCGTCVDVGQSALEPTITENFLTGSN
uniref:U23-Theraphotoxin-Sfo1g_1 n=1 Tax=Selenotholus foelschei TaxID=1905327 RepID=A0A482ZHF9_9ARAC